MRALAFASDRTSAALLALLVLGGTLLFPMSAKADSTTLGTLGGAVLGGLVGSQFGRGDGNIAATVGGVVAGGLIGNTLGRSADEEYYASRSTYYAPQPVYQQPATVYQQPTYYVQQPPVYVQQREVVVYEPYPRWRHGHRYYSRPYRHDRW